MKHGIVPRDLWLEPTFKAMPCNAKLVHLYLLTCPFGNSAHLYRVGPPEIALACGLKTKATAALIAELDNGGLLAYDFEREIVWLERQMLAELGTALQPQDKRVPYLRKLVADLPESRLTADFIERYGAVYHLETKGPSKGACKGPWKGTPIPFEAKDKVKFNSGDHHRGDSTEVVDSTTCARGQKLPPAIGGAK